MLPLAPQQALACGVSYGHMPSFRFDLPRLGLDRRCSNAASLTGAGIVAMLTISGVVIVGARAFRRGEAVARKTLSRWGEPAEVLSDYLTVTGSVKSGPEPGPAEGEDARTGP
ncbi:MULTISPECIES: hypothetical protein [unclassified Streptosporangium]|uniref:hypothetical protein n=1 Tax=unclassified Streptosporangium TaxID=2632669 RepID=UPI002E2904BA|nr:MULTISPECIES: hypothetical protein [unclassified Streptosporangium]